MNNQNNEVVNNERKLDQKTVNKVFNRYLFFMHAGFNYEKMQGLGYGYAIMPALKKLYKGKELEEAAKSHIQFYNTNVTSGALILGANLAMEEQLGHEGRDTVSSFKTALMGPLAGVGDAIIGVIPSTILGSIAAYSAIEGSLVGLWVWPAFFLFKFGLMKALLKYGYKQGNKLVTSMAGMLQNVTEAVNILGITVVGGLVPALVKAKTNFKVWPKGIDPTKLDAEALKVTKPLLDLQDAFDRIMPGLLSVLIVALTYWLLGKKGMNSTKVLFVLLVLGMILNWLGILA